MYWSVWRFSPTNYDNCTIATNKSYLKMQHKHAFALVCILTPFHKCYPNPENMNRRGKTYKYIFRFQTKRQKRQFSHF